MNTLASVLGLALVSASVVVGCGCDPGNNSDRAPVDLGPATVQASETSCTAFDLTVTTTGGSAITVTLPASATIGVAVPLNVSGSSAASQDGAVSFAFQGGADAASIEGSPLDAVIVTPTSIPTANGQSVGAEIYVGYEDGRVLDQVYGAAVANVSSSCQ